MEWVKKQVRHIDAWQRRHRLPAFVYAVVKKSGDDDAAFQGALITYYGFLSLFPLLLVAASVLQLVLVNRPDLQAEVLTNITNFIPVIGSQLNEGISDPKSSGWALVIGTLFTLYGARGAADALQFALNHSWRVQRHNRPGFPKAPLLSLSIIAVGGLGLLASVTLSAVAASFVHSAWFAVVPVLISATVLVGTFLFVFNLSIAKKLSWRELLPGALVAGIGVQLLQLFGNIIIANQLSSLSSLYGTFALVLGLLAWIYLQAQVVMYAATVNTVKYYGLWPRSLSGEDLTKEDRKAYRLYAKKERYSGDESVRVSFDDKDQ